jgi:CrcB protein
MSFLWVCLGGAVGSGARYLVHAGMVRAFGPDFPWGTFTVNLVGSFVMSWIMWMALHTQTMSPTVRLALTAGVLGGFTTYSSFNYETLHLASSGRWASALLNVGLTLVGCAAAGIAGWSAAARLLGTQVR